ncbi:MULTISPECIES: hypothetical protein [unclassified Streptomyces]|uniref:hypothetical protein n=1 Tax=unclassified Streptomyces TaxID=2593676 RepID=UPI0035E1C38B
MDDYFVHSMVFKMDFNVVITNMVRKSSDLAKLEFQGMYILQERLVRIPVGRWPGDLQWGCFRAVTAGSSPGCTRGEAREDRHRVWTSSPDSAD